MLHSKLGKEKGQSKFFRALHLFGPFIRLRLCGAFIRPVYLAPFFNMSTHPYSKLKRIIINESYK